MPPNLTNFFDFFSSIKFEFLLIGVDSNLKTKLFFRCFLYLFATNLIVGMHPRVIRKELIKKIPILTITVA